MIESIYRFRKLLIAIFLVIILSIVIYKIYEGINEIKNSTENILSPGKKT